MERPPDCLTTPLLWSSRCESLCGAWDASESQGRPWEARPSVGGAPNLPKCIPPLKHPVLLFTSLGVPTRSTLFLIMHIPSPLTFRSMELQLEKEGKLICCWAVWHNLEVAAIIQCGCAENGSLFWNQAAQQRNSLLCFPYISSQCFLFLLFIDFFGFLAARAYGTIPEAAAIFQVATVQY